MKLMIINMIQKKMMKKNKKGKYENENIKKDNKVTKINILKTHYKIIILILIF